MTLKALCYGPTGAILAAATTSLPEFIGGVRNWDYRYCWIRDASLSAGALVKLGSIDEAMDLLDWLLRVIEASEVGPERLSPLYTVNGQSLPPEATIEELAGYAGSRPVRVGNAADHQVQLDVFGPVLELIHQLGEIDAPLSARHWRLVEDLVAAVEQRWTEPDQGIWEVRSAPRHHVNSKVMCWVTVDRAVQIAGEVFGRERPEWVNLREEKATSSPRLERQGRLVATTTTTMSMPRCSTSVVGVLDMITMSRPSAVDVAASGDAVYRREREDGHPAKRAA